MNKTASLYIGIIFGFLIAGLALFFVLKNGSFFSPTDIFTIPGKSAPEAEKLDSNRLPLNYKNKTFGFSFRYPDGFGITEFSDDKGDVVLAEGGGKSFQILINIFDEPGPLTPDRIKQDLPQIAMRNVQLYKIGGAQAVVFESEDSAVGQTFEAWFVWPEIPYPNGNYLYRIASLADFKPQLKEVINTWRF